MITRLEAPSTRSNNSMATRRRRKRPPPSFSSLTRLAAAAATFGFVVRFNSDSAAVTAATPPSSFNTKHRVRDRPSRTLDLSGRHRLDAGDFATAIERYVDEVVRQIVQEGEEATGGGEDKDDATATQIEIDVSNSALGDEGLERVAGSILRPTAAAPESVDSQASIDGGGTAAKPVTLPNLSFHLISRMNDVTPRGVATFIKTILETVDDDDEKDEVGSTGNATVSTTGDDSSSANETLPADAVEDDSNNNTATSAEDDDSNNVTTTDVEAVPEGEQRQQEVSPSTIGRHGPVIKRRQRRRLESVDLCWNHLHPEARGNDREFRRAFQRLVSDPRRCPSTIRLDACGINPALCRSIGKGLIERFRANPEDDEEEDEDRPGKNVDFGTIRPLSLHLCCNNAVGDAGVAAIAAAIRTVAVSCDETEGGGASSTSDDDDDPPLGTLLDTLDLSACGVGDAGAEALALALETESSFCLVKRLDLSNNRITSVGARALARALSSPNSVNKRGRLALRSLDLSNNQEIGDRGAAFLAEEMSELARKLRRSSGADGPTPLPEISLRSCGIYADGAESFGKMLQAVIVGCDSDVRVDLSGNPIGILRGKKKEGGKYSASRLTSKAGAAAASYLNQGMSFLKKGLKDVGIDADPVLGSTAESDDEVENASGVMGDTAGEGPDSSAAKCGAKALSNAFLNQSDGDKKSGKKSLSGRMFRLGLRHCFFDHGAADALAAVLVAAKDEYGVKVDMDVSLNPILEEEMVEALHGEAEREDLLREMAERHQDALEALRYARERAAEAAAAVVASTREQDDEWDLPGGVGYEQSESEWDSDADYENEEDLVY